MYIAGRVKNIVIIRGLNFVRSELNGRDIFSANGGEESDEVTDFTPTDDYLRFADLLDPDNDGLSDDISAFVATIDVASTAGGDVVLTIPGLDGNADTVVTLANLGIDYGTFSGKLDDFNTHIVDDLSGQEINIHPDTFAS